MNYIIKMIGGEKYIISTESYKKLEGKQGLIFIPEIQCTINLSTISSIYPEDKRIEIEDRKKQQTGVLHDGTFVRKHFGQWVVDGNDVPDDKGNYSPVRVDPQYYQEIARDLVPTIEEFENIKQFPAQDRLKIILGKSKDKIESKGFEQIGEVLKNVS